MIQSQKKEEEKLSTATIFDFKLPVDLILFQRNRTISHVFVCNVHTFVCVVQVHVVLNDCIES